MPSAQRQTLLVVIGIAVLVLVMAGIAWTRAQRENPESTLEGIDMLLGPGERPSVSSTPTPAPALAPGDTVEEIESDLNRQGLEDLDQSLGGIEADLQQLR